MTSTSQIPAHVGRELERRGMKTERLVRLVFVFLLALAAIAMPGVVIVRGHDLTISVGLFAGFLLVVAIVLYDGHGAKMLIDALLEGLKTWRSAGKEA